MKIKTDFSRCRAWTLEKDTSPTDLRMALRMTWLSWSNEVLSTSLRKAMWFLASATRSTRGANSLIRHPESASKTSTATWDDQWFRLIRVAFCQITTPNNQIFMQIYHNFCQDVNAHLAFCFLFAKSFPKLTPEQNKPTRIISDSPKQQKKPKVWMPCGHISQCPTESYTIPKICLKTFHFFLKC